MPDRAVFGVDQQEKRGENERQPGAEHSGWQRTRARESSLPRSSAVKKTETPSIGVNPGRRGTGPGYGHADISVYARRNSINRRRAPRFADILHMRWRKSMTRCMFQRERCGSRHSWCRTCSRFPRCCCWPSFAAATSALSRSGAHLSEVFIEAAR